MEPSMVMMMMMMEWNGMEWNDAAHCSVNAVLSLQCSSLESREADAGRQRTELEAQLSAARAELRSGEDAFVRSAADLEASTASKGKISIAR